MVATALADPKVQSGPSEDHDHIVVIEGATWADYQRHLELRGESSVPRLAYLEGRLQIMSPSRHHETIASVLGRLVEAWCTDRGLDLTPVGSWTLEKKEADRGAEPDECYVFGDTPIEDWQVPDLAIEIVWTSGGLSKLEIYRKLGVPEVWTWKKGQIHVHVLQDDATYDEKDRSEVLPDIDLSRLAELCLVRPMTKAVRMLRDAQTP